MSPTHYDCAIIGAGMSGLAAGIRLAMYDKRVLILERHNAVGGLNSYYSVNGRKYDVGLHAMTNYVPPGTKRAPLTKILRQLRLKHEDLALAPQRGSRIAFPDVNLRFTNDFALFESEVAQAFPAEIDGFRRLVAHLDAFDETSLAADEVSARQILAHYLRDPVLVDMLMLPVCYYGSAREGDMDFSQFAIMFRALFREGFARPLEGVRQVTRLLTRRYRELGGERRMRCGVRRIVAENNHAAALELDDGTAITATHVLSSIGWVETQRLCQDQPPDVGGDNCGPLSFVETLTVLDTLPSDLGWEETIVFFNDSERFDYRCPEGLVDPRSGVICLPNNYQYSGGQQLPEGWLRVTALANYRAWAGLQNTRPHSHASDDVFAEASLDEYRRHKAAWLQRLTEQALAFLPGGVSAETVHARTRATDMFTPLTIERYTGHLGGAIYGSPRKNKPGTTHLENLYLCGTDQGFLGITGAMLSGISMANAHILGAQASPAS